MAEDEYDNIKECEILHWNYRDFEEFPNKLRCCGKHLQDIYLKGNRIYKIPEWISELENLVEIHIAGNNLHELPEKISTLKLLKKVDVSQNQIIKLPNSITSLINLDYLSAAENQLTELPSDIGKLKSLTFLDVNRNKIRFIPDSICDCFNLQELNMQENEIIMLPPRIVYLQNLEFISLESNKLLYLPAVPFFREPYILINENNYLTYISFDIAELIFRKYQQQGLEFNFQSQNLVTNNKENLSKFKLKNHTAIESETGVILLLPLNNIFQDKDTVIKLIPTLYELTLRQVYNYSYDILNYEKMGTTINVLPRNIQEELMNGPVAYCHYCKVSLFNYAFIKLYHISSTNNNYSQQLICRYFCSNTCCKLFLDFESFSPFELQLVSWKYYNL